MINFRAALGKYLRPITWIGLGVLVGLLVFAAGRPAHALPEYATRTGQPCATCHVNPAGGGPRTLRGSLWVAEDRPDQVPPLPGTEEEVESATLDGQQLFGKFACSGCHGVNGEGSVAPALSQREWTADEITQIIRNGQGTMMAYSQDAISEAELVAVVEYVLAIGRGEIQGGSVLEKDILPPAQLTCGETAPAGLLGTGCGGN